VGRSGLATQAIGAFDVALYDLKARRAGLSLAKLLGSTATSVACYNTSGGFLHTPLDQLLVNAAASRERGIGGIKLKVGQPDRALDIQRVKAVRQHLGDAAPLMVDANQQWDRPTAQRMCRVFEDFNLVWIEEPLDAYDHEGHAALAAQFDTPIATGEMLTSAAEHGDLIRHRAADYLMPDAPRVGGITPFLKIAAQADAAGLMLAPHFAMELHVHLAAAYPTRALGRTLRLAGAAVQRTAEIGNGRMVVPTRPGLGLSLSEQARAWTRADGRAGVRPIARPLPCPHHDTFPTPSACTTATTSPSWPTTAAWTPAPCCPVAGLVLRDRVPQGHKVALVDIAAGAPVLRYGIPIGHALKDIEAGSWVHERLLQMPDARGLDDLPMATSSRRRCRRWRATPSRATATPTARWARATSWPSRRRCSAWPASPTLPCSASRPSCCRATRTSTTWWRWSTATAAAWPSTRPTRWCRSARCATSA
jgi:L-alanine-DL-glutamate epimerase-like enolase superfamily enzyme